MMISETLHVEGKSVGRMIVDTNAKEVTFEPNENPTLVPDRNWNGVDELRQAVIQAYTSENPGY